VCGREKVALPVRAPRPDPLKQATIKPAVPRTQAPAADFAGLRTKLESEQARSCELEKTLAEKTVAAEAAPGCD